MQALHGYDLHAVAEKDEDDGSDVLMWVCGEREWDGTFILTGVNLDACVKRTAEGLARLDKQVEVLGWACNTHSGNYNSPWDSFEDELANIVWREAA